MKSTLLDAKETERRMYRREPSSGPVTFKAFLGSNDFHESHYKNYTHNMKHFCGAGELIDKSEGGLCIKTEFQLEKGHLLEVSVPAEQLALVRWVAQRGEHCLAGLMFT